MGRRRQKAYGNKSPIPLCLSGTKESADVRNFVVNVTQDYFVVYLIRT